MGTSSSKGERNRRTENQAVLWGLPFNTLKTALQVNSNRTFLADSYQSVFRGQIGLSQRESGLDRVERAGSYGRRRGKIVVFPLTLPMSPRVP